MIKKTFIEKTPIKTVPFVFIPFVQERDNVGRLISPNTKVQNFFNKKSIPRTTESPKGFTITTRNKIILKETLK